MPVADVPTTNKLITDAVLFAKLTVPQLVKNFSDFFFATPRFITVFKKIIISPYPQPDQSSPWSHIICSRPILILPLHQRLDLQSGLFPSGFTT